MTSCLTLGFRAILAHLEKFQVLRDFAYVSITLCQVGKSPWFGGLRGHEIDREGHVQFFQVTISSALPSLNPRELALATENYNENNIIGDGGFGLVYKAVLNCGSIVVVKKLLEDGAQGQNEFLAEMRTFGKIKHRNLVSLLGYCAYGKARMLVYELMKNGVLTPGAL